MAIFNIACASALLAVDAGTLTISKVFDLPYGESGAVDLIHKIERVVIDPDGKLYFTDVGDHGIKAFSFTSRTVSIIAGNRNVGPAKPGAIATSGPLRYPQSLAVASDGTVYSWGWSLASSASRLKTAGSARLACTDQAIEIP